MIDNEVKTILDRVLTWPRKRQVKAAVILAEMEEVDGDVRELSDEQIAEVRRRLADKKAKYIPHREAWKRLRKLGA